MKTRNVRRELVWLALVLMAGAQAARGESKTFEIDPVHSCVLFRIQHLYTMFTGRFNAFTGVITGDPDDPSSLRVTAEVDVLSVDTANKDREKHLLTPDFFDAKRFAVARFTSTRTVPGENKSARVTGNMTIRDVTSEVTFSVKFLGYGPDQAKGKCAGFHAEARINRQDFGVSYPGKMPDGRVILGDEVDLILEIAAVEKAAAASTPAKSLAERLVEIKAASPSASTPEVAAALARAEEEIKAKGGIEGLKIGDRAPDFTLPDTAGEKISLAHALAKGPAVVVFFRGEWCPYCNLQMRSLEEVYPEIRKLGASILAVTPQKQDKSAAQETKNALSFPLLSDTTGDVLRRYRLLYTIPQGMREVFLKEYKLDLEQYNGEGRWELPVTATYIIGKDGVIAAGVADFDYTKRMEPKDILAALRKLKP